MSRFYAFEDTPPYKVVARTGKFCFGYPTKEDQSLHPLSDMQNNTALGANEQLWFAFEKLNCPRIHFVSGMTTKYGDDSKVIISYGINDCLSRFVEVSKFEIARMLWNPMQ